MAAADRDSLRRAAETRGRRGETVAAWYLRLKGYRVLARRYRTPAGEIDLVVRRARCIVFVEVKHRPKLDEAADAVSPTGRRRIARAAALWLSAHPQATGLDQRFDMVLIAPGRWPRHLVSAFDGAGGIW